MLLTPTIRMMMMETASTTALTIALWSTTPTRPIPITTPSVTLVTSARVHLQARLLTQTPYQTATVAQILMRMA